jgi:hypothetical protein
MKVWDCKKQLERYGVVDGFETWRRECSHFEEEGI